MASLPRGHGARLLYGPYGGPPWVCIGRQHPRTGRRPKCDLAQPLGASSTVSKQEGERLWDSRVTRALHRQGRRHPVWGVAAGPPASRMGTAAPFCHGVTCAPGFRSLEAPSGLRLLDESKCLRSWMLPLPRGEAPTGPEGHSRLTKLRLHTLVPPCAVPAKGPRATLTPCKVKTRQGEQEKTAWSAHQFSLSLWRGRFHHGLHERTVTKGTHAGGPHLTVLKRVRLTERARHREPPPHRTAPRRPARTPLGPALQSRAL